VLPFVQESVISGVFSCVVATANQAKSDAFVEFCKDFMKEKDSYFYM
jgi:hypothetical protein